MLLIDLRDLLSSGRLTVLARVLGMNMGDAYLAVSIAWETTQLAEIVLTNEIEFEDVCRVRIGAMFPELHPRQLLDAMRKSDLARDSEDGVEIVGNAKQLKKIAHWKENASRGGKKSQERLREKKLNDSVEQVLEQNRATVEQRSSNGRAKSSPLPLPLPLPLPNSVSDGRVPDLPTPINERPQTDARALELEKKYLEARGRFGQRLTAKERADANEIVFAAGGAWEQALDSFLADEREYYRERKWALSLLVNDLGDHLTAAGPKKKRTWYNPITDEHIEIKGDGP